MLVSLPPPVVEGTREQPASRSREPRAWRSFVVQLLVVAAGIGVYFGTRGLTEGRSDLALRNAARVVRFEQALGIAREAAVQARFVHRDALLDAANWIYIWGHWPVIVCVLLWCYLRHPQDYRLLRNAMFVSGAIGLVIFAAFPVAPPRLASIGLIDTVTERSHAYRVLQPPAFVNQYAAMPSLHVGWDLLVGLVVVRCARTTVLRWLGALMPLAMTAAVVITANHYIIDTVAGALLALGGLVIARRAWPRVTAAP